MMTSELSARSRLTFAAIGMAVMLAAGAALVAGAVRTHPGATRYSATFGRAGQGLDERSKVKIRGVAVGRVNGVALNAKGRAVVRFELDRGVKVPRTASAGIEPVSVFGPKDLTLDLGAGEGRGPYLPSGGNIAKTTDPQELSDTAWPAYRLTSALNPEEIATVLQTFSAGLNGRGPALRRTIDNASTVVDVAYRNRAALRQALVDIEGLAGTLSSRGDEIVAITRDFNTLSPVLSSRPDKITQLLDGASRAAATVGDGLQNHGDQAGTVIDTGGDLVNVLYRQRRNLPLLIDGLNGFFGGISTILRVPGPSNTLLAQAVVTLPLNLCLLLVDVCPQQGAG
jgi:phospholipid/cholesterol/gamma-HCH transport system substrate-binding protein